MNDFLTRTDTAAKKEVSKYEQVAGEVFALMRDFVPIEQHRIVQHLKDNIRQYWEGLATQARETIERNEKGMAEMKSLNESL